MEPRIDRRASRFSPSDRFDVNRRAKVRRKQGGAGTARSPVRPSQLDGIDLPDIIDRHRLNSVRVQTRDAQHQYNSKEVLNRSKGTGSVTDILKVLAALAVGYFLGSLNTAVIVGKIYGKDINSHGSRSAGLTNALRVLGRSAAVFVLIGDILKGVVACFIGLELAVYVYDGEAKDCVSLLAAGAGAVLGHNWPVYFGFKGGKGALTAAAVMFVFNWVMALTSLGVFIIVIALTRYVSLGTISATVFFVALSFVPAFHTTLYFQLFASVLATVIVLKHRENIRRLLSGAENRLTF